MTDKCEASHLPSGLRPSAGNLQAGGRGGARDQPEKPAHGARQAQGCGLTALQAAHGTAAQEAGTPGSAHVYPALPRAPALQQPSERWRAPISRVKVQAHSGGALLPAGLCFHLQRNFQEGNSSDPLTLPVPETVGNEEVPNQSLFLEEADFKCWKSAFSLCFHLSQSREDTCYADPAVPLGGLVRRAEQAVMAPGQRGGREKSSEPSAPSICSGVLLSTCFKLKRVRYGSSGSN